MPFNEDLDRTPIDVLADKYGAGGGAVRAFESVISLQVTVPTAAKTLAELLEAEEVSVVNEATGFIPDGSLDYAEGTIGPQNSPMTIRPNTIEFTTAATTINDDGAGNLTGDATGTIDYDTGAWRIFWPSAPAAGGEMVVDYNWYFVLPEKLNGLWLYPAGTIRATFSEDGVPTAAIGIELPATTLFDLKWLQGQPTLIRNAKFIAGVNTLVDIEVLVDD